MSGNEPDEHGLEHPSDVTVERNSFLADVLLPGPKPQPPDSDPDPRRDVVEIVGDSSTVEQQMYADPGLGEHGDPPPPPPPTEPPSPSGDATFVGAKADDDPLENATFAPTSANAFKDAQTGLNDVATNSVGGAPRVIAPIAIVGLLLVGLVGFIATRPDSGQGSAATNAPVPTAALPTTTSAPAPTAAPVVTNAATAPAAAPRVTDTKITEQGNVCLNQTTFIFSVKVEGAKAGDSIHVKITGPGLPSEANGTLGADGTVTGTIGVTGPVKGNQQWSAQVDQIAGKPIVSGPAQVFGFCPTS